MSGMKEANFGVSEKERPEWWQRRRSLNIGANIDQERINPGLDCLYIENVLASTFPRHDLTADAPRRLDPAETNAETVVVS